MPFDVSMPNLSGKEFTGLQSTLVGTDELDATVSVRVIGMRLLGFRCYRWVIGIIDLVLGSSYGDLVRLKGRIHDTKIK